MIITAKFSSLCPGCRRQISAGTQVSWASGRQASHVACAGRGASTSAPARRSAPSRRGAGSAAPVRGYAAYCTGRSDCGCYDCSS